MSYFVKCMHVHKPWDEGTLLVKNCLQEEEIGKARREVGTAAKEMQQAQKVISQFEARQDQKRSEKHGLLKHCKV